MARRVERGVTREGEPARMPAAGRVCGKGAGPDWCPDPVFSRGMCRRHYRRAAKGLPLDPDEGRVVGITPSGHGVWGVLTERGGRVRCHECGRWLIALSVHVGMVHDGTRAYRLAHGLPLSVTLDASALHETRSEHAIDADIVAQITDARSPETLTLADQDLATRGNRLARARRPRT